MLELLIEASIMDFDESAAMLDIKESIRIDFILRLNDVVGWTDGCQWSNCGLRLAKRQLEWVPLSLRFHDKTEQLRLRR